MYSPIRIQRKRIKGWKMPPNTIYVGRPTKWGNPYAVFGKSDILYGNASYRRKILSPWIYINNYISNSQARIHCLRFYIRWIKGENKHFVNPCNFTIEDIKKELKGKNLACWCSLKQYCHADYLLLIANE